MTAVEWLFEKLPTIDKYDPYYSDIFQQAKEMEKEQIIKARLSLDQSIHLEDALDRAEQYYNQKYKQD